MVQSLDKNAPVYGVRTVDELLDRSVATPRFNTLLLGLFAAVALILTTVGLYGVISCSVSENTQQIGIRVALGAQRSDVFKLIVGQGVTLTIAGVVIGLVAAYGLTRLMSSLLFGVGSTDPVDVHGCRGSVALRGGDRVLPAGTPRDERRSDGGSQARLAAPVLAALVAAAAVPIHHRAHWRRSLRSGSSPSVALSARVVVDSRQLLAGTGGGLAAPVPARGRGTRRDQARAGVVVLRASARAAIRLCRRAHAGSGPIVARAHPVRRGLK